MTLRRKKYLFQIFLAFFFVALWTIYQSGAVSHVNLQHEYRINKAHAQVPPSDVGTIPQQTKDLVATPANPNPGDTVTITANGNSGVASIGIYVFRDTPVKNNCAQTTTCYPVSASPPSGMPSKDQFYLLKTCNAKTCTATYTIPSSAPADQRFTFVANMHTKTSWWSTGDYACAWTEFLAMYNGSGGSKWYQDGSGVKYPCTNNWDYVQTPKPPTSTPKPTNTPGATNTPKPGSTNTPTPTKTPTPKPGSTNTPTPKPGSTNTPTPNSGTCTFRVYGYVYNSNDGSRLNNAEVKMFKSGDPTRSDTTDSNGNYSIVFNRSCEDSSYTISWSGPSGAGCGAESAIYSFTSGNNYTRNINRGLSCSVSATATPTPTPTTTAATNTPTPTPEPPDGMSVRVMHRESMFVVSPLSNSLVSIYEQTAFNTLIPVGSKTTNSSGFATWNTLPGGQFGYRIVLTDKGPGRSGWDIVIPSSGLNYYTNVPKASVRLFMLEDNTAATPTPTTTTGSDPYSIVGQIVEADTVAECTTSPSPFALADLTLYREDASIVNSMNNQASYNFSGTTDTAQDHTLSISMPAGFSLIGIRNGAGPYGSSSFTDYVIPNFSSNPTGRNISFCVKAATLAENPWFMTEIGSVRQQSIFNPVPIGSSATGGAPNTSSVFYSTLGDSSLGASSGLKWQVNKEYQEVPSLSRTGNASFSFYKNRAKTAGDIAVPLPTCPATGNCNFSGSLNTLGANNIFLVNGNLTITNAASTNLTLNRRYVIIADGNITFEKGVTITNDDALLIFAAKNNLVIKPGVGTNDFDADPIVYNMQAILTAENNIVVEGNANCPATPDRRLNIEGSLVANAENPFGVDTSGGGLLINQRTLCDDNVTAPSLYVKSRLSFIVGLTDFYKVSSKYWNEVAP